MTIAVVLLVVLVGVVVGGMSAMFGVGGGVLMVPFIVIFLGETQHLAEGTSLLVMIPTALMGVWVHSRRGFVRFRAAALVGIPGIAGALSGAWLAHRVDAATLKTVFGIFTVLVGLKTLRDGLRDRGAQDPSGGVSPTS